MDTGTAIALAGVLIPVATSSAYAVVKMAVAPTKEKLAAHEAADEVTHENLQRSLDRVESKIDRLVDKLLD